jgi:hypothetical protein
MFPYKGGGVQKEGDALVSMLQAPVNERCVVVKVYLYNEVKIIYMFAVGSQKLLFQV